MKKIIFTFGLLLTTVISMNAQDIAKNAIGLRFGGGDGLGGDISYQRALGSNNRLELNLGLGNDLNDFKATGLYQWVWKIDGGFNWYAGFGGGVIATSNTGLFGAGNIGIEYNFGIPLMLSLDFRPEVGITGSLNGVNPNTALGLRYQF